MINDEGKRQIKLKKTVCKNCFLFLNLDYTDLHRATLQTISGYGTVEEKEFKIIFESIWKNCEL